MDRRDFLKRSGAALALPLVGLTAIEAPALKSASSTICGGEWNELPVGWARLSHIPECSPLNEDGSLVYEGSRHPSTMLMLMGLSESQIAHALAECDCSDGTDITSRNDLWWGLEELETDPGEGPSLLWTGGRAFYRDDCDCDGGDCECLIAMYHPPGQQPIVCDLGDEFGDRGARLRHQFSYRRELALEWRERQS